MNNDDQVLHKKSLSDEVLRKIGRNVLLFQQIQGLLKFLVANHRSDGTNTNFKERQQKRAEKIQKQMLGMLTVQICSYPEIQASSPFLILEGAAQNSTRLRLYFFA